MYVHFSVQNVLQSAQIVAMVFYGLDLFHRGSQLKYSSVLMLISLSILTLMNKFQRNIYFKVSAVGLSNISQKNVKVVAIYESGLLNALQCN